MAYPDDTVFLHLMLRRGKTFDNTTALFTTFLTNDTYAHVN